MDTINTTALARQYGVTTKALEQRLKRLGISPAQEVAMPSGKRFILWPAKESIEALERYKNEAKPRRAATASRAGTGTEALEAQVKELRDMVSTLMEQLQKQKIG